MGIQWQVVDVPRMIERTGDPKGDVWYQTQSAFIEVVSTVTLKDFMANVSDIVSRAELTDVSFYEQRGLALHGLEVVRYECTDPNTERVSRRPRRRRRTASTASRSRKAR